MKRRIAHHGQAGSRLSGFDSLFEQVERVKPKAIAPIEAIPVPEVTELKWPEPPVLVEEIPAWRLRK